MHITEKTSRADLLAAIYAEPELLGAFIAAGYDPYQMDTQAIYAFVQAWIQAGDETSAS